MLASRSAPRCNSSWTNSLVSRDSHTLDAVDEGFHRRNPAKDAAGRAVTGGQPFGSALFPRLNDRLVVNERSPA